MTLAIAAIDAANRDDPNTLTIDGVSQPKELAHAQLVSRWVIRLRPDASESLLLAARAHHFRRWLSPRSTYPDGRAGYLRWRRDLSRRQADDVGRLLEDLGYGRPTVDRVQAIMQKRDLSTDPDVQALEDAICLVFLDTQFDELAARLDRDHVISILKKTLVKMSPAAKELAGTLSLSPEGQALLAAATA
jgi:hypothetical protein